MKRVDSLEIIENAFFSFYLNSLRRILLRTASLVKRRTPLANLRVYTACNNNTCTKCVHNNNIIITIIVVRIRAHKQRAHPPCYVAEKSHSYRRKRFTPYLLNCVTAYVYVYLSCAKESHLSSGARDHCTYIYTRVLPEGYFCTIRRPRAAAVGVRKYRARERGVGVPVGGAVEG